MNYSLHAAASRGKYSSKEKLAQREIMNNSSDVGKCCGSVFRAHKLSLIFLSESSWSIEEYLRMESSLS